MYKTIKILELAKSVGIEFALNQDKDIGRFLELFLDRYLYEVSLHDYWNIMDFFNSHKINTGLLVVRTSVLMILLNWKMLRKTLWRLIIVG